MDIFKLFKRWTPRTLLEAALNKLTPKNWAQGDYMVIDEFGRETFCVVGMATKIVGLNPSQEEDYIHVENWLSDNGLTFSEIESMNDSAESLESFKVSLRAYLGIA